MTLAFSVATKKDGVRDMRIMTADQKSLRKERERTLIQDKLKRLN